MSRDERILWIRDGLVAWGDKRSVEALDSLVADLRAARAERDAERADAEDLAAERAAAINEAAALRARLEKAREALAVYADEHMGHSMECTTHACRSCCCGLDDLRAALEES